MQLAQMEGMFDGCGCDHMNMLASAHSKSGGTGKRCLPAWSQLTGNSDMLLLQVNTVHAAHTNEEEHKQKHSQRQSCGVGQLTALGRGAVIQA